MGRRRETLFMRKDQNMATTLHTSWTLLKSYFLLLQFFLRTRKLGLQASSASSRSASLVPTFTLTYKVQAFAGPLFISSLFTVAEHGLSDYRKIVLSSQNPGIHRTPFCYLFIWILNNPPTLFFGSWKTHFMETQNSHEILFLWELK